MGIPPVVMQQFQSPFHRATIAELKGFIPFRQARHYYSAKRGFNDLIVFHVMVSGETLDTAEGLGNYFATTDRRASTQYGIDANSIMQYVRDSDTCFGAPGMNHNGIHIEHAGQVTQTREQWLDGYGLAEHNLSAKLIVALCFTHNIPPNFVDARELATSNRPRGITTHYEGTKAWTIHRNSLYRGDHTDPGDQWPRDWFMDLVRYYYYGGSPLDTEELWKKINESQSSQSGLFWSLIADNRPFGARFIANEAPGAPAGEYVIIHVPGKGFCKQNLGAARDLLIAGGSIGTKVVWLTDLEGRSQDPQLLAAFYKLPNA